jgi:hypothetical protein
MNYPIQSTVAKDSGVTELIPSFSLVNAADQDFNARGIASLAHQMEADTTRSTSNPSDNESIVAGTTIGLHGEFSYLAPVASVPQIVFSATPGSGIKEGWQIELEEKIDNIGILPPDFDAEGSPSIKLENMAAAKALIALLYQAKKIKCTDVFPTSKGGIEIEIASTFWQAAIWVDSPTRVEYVVKVGKSTIDGDSDLDDVPEKIWEALG